MPDTPRLVFRGPTRRCNPACKHCRAEAAETDCSAGPDIASAKKAIDDSIAFANPIMVLTGAEPLCRDDIVDSAGHAASRRLRVALATNAALIDEQCAHQIQQAGITPVGISSDGSTSASHDDFGGIPRALDAAARGVRLLRERWFVSVQHNRYQKRCQRACGYTAVCRQPRAPRHCAFSCPRL